MSATKHSQINEEFDFFKKRDPINEEEDNDNKGQNKNHINLFQSQSPEAEGQGGRRKKKKSIIKVKKGGKDKLQS